MKKFLIMLLGVTLAFYSCETVQEDDAADNEAVSADVQKQYFEESADIDLAKKLISNYLSGDLEASRSLYLDTALIWRNTNWSLEGGGLNEESAMDVSAYIEDLKSGLEPIDNYDFVATNYQSIVTNNGQHWAYFWGVWTGHSPATDKTYEIPVHLAMNIVNGKIAYQGDFFNNAEITMDMQALQAAQ